VHGGILASPPSKRKGLRVRYTFRMAIFEPVFKALNERGVRYVVVGGLAVVLHGHPRMTVDVDLVIDLDEREAMNAIEGLLAIGLTPRLPVDARQFADRAVREAWVRDRGVQVFSMIDQSNALRVVDLFATHPIPFEGLWSRSEEMSLTGSTIRVASIPDLIAMKRISGRPLDQSDVEQLEAIQKARQARLHG